MPARFVPPTNQILKNGAPLSRGKLYFYEVGGLTPKDTYSDQALSTANANPVILSQEGYYPNIFLDGNYRVILKDAGDVQVWDRDYVNDELTGVDIEDADIGQTTAGLGTFTDMQANRVFLYESSAGTGDKYIRLDNDGSGFRIQSLTDALAADGTLFRVAQSGGTALSITLGNNIDEPATVVTGLLQCTVTDSITAGSTQTQAGATQLSSTFNIVETVGTDNDGVKLPTAATGLVVWIRNADAAQDIQIWPNTSDTINGGSANAVDPTPLGEGAGRLYVADGTTNWNTVF